MLFNLTNLPYWILLGIGIFLFVVVIFSGGGDDDLDLDADADADGDLLDLDTDGDFSPLQILGWFGFGKAPLILLLATDFCLWGLLGWMLNTTFGDLLQQIPVGFWAGAIFVISLVLALVIGSLVSRPIGKALASFGEETSRDRLIGCIGTVSSALIPRYQEERVGQVDVLDAARNRVTVIARLPEWATIVPRFGEKVLVIDCQPQHYLVIVKDSPDQEHWMNSPPAKD
jgi:hypothetical protein